MKRLNGLEMVIMGWAFGMGPQPAAAFEAVVLDTPAAVQGAVFLAWDEAGGAEAGGPPPAGAAPAQDRTVPFASSPDQGGGADKAAGPPVVRGLRDDR